MTRTKVSITRANARNPPVFQVKKYINNRLDFETEISPGPLNYINLRYPTSAAQYVVTSVRNDHDMFECRFIAGSKRLILTSPKNTVSRTLQRNKWSVSNPCIAVCSSSYPPLTYISV